MRNWQAQLRGGARIVKRRIWNSLPTDVRCNLSSLQMYFQTSGFHLDYVFNAALSLFKIYALITVYLQMCP